MISLYTIKILEIKSRWSSPLYTSAHTELTKWWAFCEELAGKNGHHWRKPGKRYVYLSLLNFCVVETFLFHYTKLMFLLSTWHYLKVSVVLKVLLVCPNASVPWKEKDIRSVPRATGLITVYSAKLHTDSVFITRRGQCGRPKSFNRYPQVQSYPDGH